MLASCTITSSGTVQQDFSSMTSQFYDTASSFLITRMLARSAAFNQRTGPKEKGGEEGIFASTWAIDEKESRLWSSGWSNFFHPLHFQEQGVVGRLYPCLPMIME